MNCRNHFYRSIAAGVFFASFFAMIVSIGAMVVHLNGKENRSALTAEGVPSVPAPARLVPLKKRLAF